MAKLRGYACSCGNRFEHTFMTRDEEATLPECPACGARVCEDNEVFGGTVFHTIIPMYPGSLKQKAGYVHTHADRPAEKGSVAVPRKGNV